MPNGQAVNIPIKRETLRTYGGQAIETNVVRPRDQSELSAFLRDVVQGRRNVAFRGGGRSFDTQSLNTTYVISLDAFSGIRELNVQERFIKVGATTAWGCILKCAAQHSLVPYVTVTSSRATAGGTLSADCLSRFSPSCGKEGAHVRSFEFMTLEGLPLSCSRDQNPELFKAVISGLGCLGVVYEITYDLIQLDIPPGEIAVHTRLTPIKGLKHLADTLVDEVHDHQRKLCQSANLVGASAHAARSTIAAARQAPHEITAISAVLYLNTARQGLLMRSQYVRAKAEDLKPCFLHQPDRPLHRFLQVAALSTWGRRLGWWLTLNFFFKHALEFTDELFGFTFFQNGNEAIHERGREFGLPVGTLQQTYVIRWDPGDRPGSSRRLVKFLEAADALLDAHGLLPALIDVLYVPDDAGDGFLLSSSRNLSGFAVTFTFEDVLSSDFSDERAALREIAKYCEQAEGRVHLVKHVYADNDVLERMYGSSVDELIALKRRHDPRTALRSDFLQRVFPRLFS